MVKEEKIVDVKKLSKEQKLVGRVSDNTDKVNDGLSHENDVYNLIYNSQYNDIISLKRSCRYSLHKAAVELYGRDYYNKPNVPIRLKVNYKIILKLNEDKDNIENRKQLKEMSKKSDVEFDFNEFQKLRVVLEEGTSVRDGRTDGKLWQAGVIRDVCTYLGKSLIYIVVFPDDDFFLNSEKYTDKKTEISNINNTILIINNGGNGIDRHNDTIDLALKKSDVMKFLDFLFSNVKEYYSEEKIDTYNLVLKYKKENGLLL